MTFYLELDIQAISSESSNIFFDKKFRGSTGKIYVINYSKTHGKTNFTVVFVELDFGTFKYCSSRAIVMVT